MPDVSTFDAFYKIGALNVDAANSVTKTIQQAFTTVNQGLLAQANIQQQMMQSAIDSKKLAIDEWYKTEQVKLDYAQLDETKSYHAGELANRKQYLDLQAIENQDKEQERLKKANNQNFASTLTGIRSNINAQRMVLDKNIGATTDTIKSLEQDLPLYMAQSPEAYRKQVDNINAKKEQLLNYQKDYTGINSKFSVIETGLVHAMNGADPKVVSGLISDQLDPKELGFFREQGWANPAPVEYDPNDIRGTQKLGGTLFDFDTGTTRNNPVTATSQKSIIGYDFGKAQSVGGPLTNEVGTQLRPAVDADYLLPDENSQVDIFSHPEAFGQGAQLPAVNYPSKTNTSAGFTLSEIDNSIGLVMNNKKIVPENKSAIINSMIAKADPQAQANIGLRRAEAAAKYFETAAQLSSSKSMGYADESIKDAHARAATEFEMYGGNLPQLNQQVTSVIPTLKQKAFAESEKLGDAAVPGTIFSNKVSEYVDANFRNPAKETVKAVSRPTPVLGLANTVAIGNAVFGNKEIEIPALYDTADTKDRDSTNAINGEFNRQFAQGGSFDLRSFAMWAGKNISNEELGIKVDPGISDEFGRTIKEGTSDKDINKMREEAIRQRFIGAADNNDSTPEEEARKYFIKKQEKKNKPLFERLFN